LLLVCAIVRPFKLGDLQVAVAQLGVQGMTVIEVQGYGAQDGHEEHYRGQQLQVEFIPRVMVQIVVEAGIVEPVMEAIANVARTGKTGDGRIFVSRLDQAIRIRTGETGNAAA
jgi:nitrogen regulatory protein PII